MGISVVYRGGNYHKAGNRIRMYTNRHASMKACNQCGDYLFAECPDNCNSCTDDGSQTGCTEGECDDESTFKSDDKTCPSKHQLRSFWSTLAKPPCIIIVSKFPQVVFGECNLIQCFESQIHGI